MFIITLFVFLFYIELTTELQPESRRLLHNLSNMLRIHGLVVHSASCTFCITQTVPDRVSDS